MSEDILDPLVYALGREGFEVATRGNGRCRSEARSIGDIRRDRARPHVAGNVGNRRVPNTPGRERCSNRDAHRARHGARPCAGPRARSRRLCDEAVLHGRARQSHSRNPPAERARPGGNTQHLHSCRDRDRPRSTRGSGRRKLHSAHPVRVSHPSATCRGTWTRLQPCPDHGAPWRTPYIGDARACDTHISNLRRKIERDPAHPTRIVTVREAGYRLTPPPTV